MNLVTADQVNLPKNVPPVLLSVATDESTLRNFRALVFEQYGIRNWLEKSDHPDGLVTDEFDNNATVLTVQFLGEVVAGMRIVKDTEKGFPHEHELGLAQFDKEGYYEDKILHKIAKTDRSRMAEITKLVGKKKERMLTIDLAKCIYWYAINNDIDLYVMVIDRDFLQLCTILGIPIHPIGPDVYCEGSWTTPAVIDPSQFPESMSRRSKKYWGYISVPDNLQNSLRHH